MKFLRTFAIILAAMLLVAIPLRAGSRILSGKVLDSGNKALEGVAVLVRGSSNGTMTSSDGTFRLSVGSEDVTLEVSCLSYVTKTVPVKATQDNIVVILEDDSMSITETVVVGYGTQKKVNLTGAITTVDQKQLENRTAHSLTDMLQGSVPGLNISTDAGNPGSTGSLNIRGITSINSADPIVLIDGAIGDLSRVNPNDVESISVIKDAAAAAVYGARAAYGVILITTKSGSDKDGKAIVHYSGRFGWETPTTSTDYETRGYWSVYTIDKFWMSDAGNKYTTYNDHDMAELLARVNDKTEQPGRPWVVEDVRNGKKQWIYYANTDWYHELYRDRHPVQQHSVSVSGGNKDIKYFLSGGYDRQTGIIKVNPDVFQKYNLRAKIDFKVNKFIKMSNNTSFYSSRYTFPGMDDVQDSFAYASCHALASFPLKNPDGSWLYATPMISGAYNVAWGRHIIFGDKNDINNRLKSDFSNTTEIKITPVKQFNIVSNFTYRLYQNRNTYRQTNFSYRQRPGGELESYTVGAGEDYLDESIATSSYYSGNVYATYDDTFCKEHHVKAMLGSNMEYWYRKSVGAKGKNLQSKVLSDLDLVGPNAFGDVLTEVSGGQKDYALLGVFGRFNYDYKGKYLIEISGRLDGSSRFAKGHRWGFFPSVSAGWRISEEPFFGRAKRYVNNLKLRASYGSLGNQNVNYYAYLRSISINDFKGYSFNEGSTMAKYSTLSGPVAADLTWETSKQYNIGLDLGMFSDKLNFTAEAYVRKTVNMLTKGEERPGVFGANPPKTNTADLKTSGYELSISWRDRFNLAGKPFGYGVRASLSDYRSYITRFNNPQKNLSDYYPGKRLGDIWGFQVDGLFATDEEAKEYTKNTLDCSYINRRMTGGWRAGDLKFVDLDGDGILGIGANNADKPGDRKILGNSLPSLQYGFTLSLDYMGFDISAFFQGTGTHYWYPAGMNMAFWGPYSYSYVSFLQRDFIEKCWSEENPNAYFPRPRAYSSTGGELSKVNSRYLQNIAYLRFKNLTIGYTLPEKLTRKIAVDKVRFYFSGENLAYWSPLKKHTRYIDPESAFKRRSGDNPHDRGSYPWMKTMMFGVDITF